MDADNLDFLGDALAVARIAADAATGALREAEGRAQGIAGRVVALASDRDSIKRRRAAGDERSDDGARLALIAADLENLLELEAESSAHLAELRASHKREATVLAQSQATFTHEEARMTLAAHDDHLAKMLTLVQEAFLERQKVARSLPMKMHDFPATIARLKTIDRMMVGELKSIRAHVPFRGISYMGQPTYEPSPELYDFVWRLENGGGRFV